MNVTQLIEKLNANKFMRSDEEVMSFDFTLAELALHPNSEYLPALYLVFDDRCEQHEVMYGLIHFLESFELKDQLQAFIDTIDRMVVNAKEWTMILLYGILNQDLSRNLYSQMLHSNHSQNRDLCTHLLREIVPMNPLLYLPMLSQLFPAQLRSTLILMKFRGICRALLNSSKMGNILVLLQDDRPIAEIKPIK
jgi:hypothetical protein